ncbi:MAG: bis(5'-nucleosyl)-tetraphosphatase [Planctomycetota bacterium]|jgi:8-oxo-dGTP pyrophosphatase MutT (NUDIX family)
MEQTWAAGVVLAHHDAGVWKYLLLKSAEHGTWGFAKGHAEAGEDEITAARREVTEETGISDYRLVDGFHDSYEYDVNTSNRGAYRKRVHYYLGVVQEQTMQRSEEHSDARWMNVDEAKTVIDREQTLQTLLKASAALESELKN